MSNETVQAVLFDLDGTLLPMDTHQFVQDYLKELAPRVAHQIKPEPFIQALWAGTEAMIKNLDPAKTNEQVFEETFLQLTKVNKEDVWPTLDAFYENVFPTLSHLCEPTPTARKVVEAALVEGYKVTVATNPVFPQSAIKHRLKWAGIEDMPFELVTYYENSVFTKPHLQYYEWICNKMGVSPDDCVMVGNDIQEDMSASKLGMRTFLVEGYVIDRGEPTYRVDQRGTLEDLLHQIKAHEGIFAK